jgi:capsular polysaccharide biosynthesis protein
MDIFNQKKVLIRIIILLVLLNLISITFFVLKDKHHHEPLLFPKNEAYKDVSGVLKKELQLNDEQLNNFNSIRERFFEKEVILKQTIRNQKDSMNVEMFNKTTNENLVKSLAQKISENEYKMEMLRYAQAKELKAVCTPEQQERFQNFVIEIRDYFRPDNQPKRK